TRLESFHDHIRIALIGTHTGLAVDSDDRHALRHAEIHFRRSGQSLLHEGLEHRRCETAARIAAAKRCGRIITHEHADYEIGRETNEPGVLLIVGRTGLASHRAVEALQNLRRAALNDAFHHRGDLISGHGIEYLITIVDQRRLVLIGPILCIAAFALARIVLEHGLAVAILNAVDHRRRYALAAIRHDGIGRHHAQNGRFTGTKRHGENGQHLVVDAKAFRIFSDELHAHVLRETHGHDVT